ncbi:MAG: hydrolase [Nitrospirales bacterium]|nr:MAG: hydrolase [Nitrospirales bacterium]
MNIRSVSIAALRYMMLGWDECIMKPFVRTWPKRAGKKILCFGDSNTWGSIPVTGLRYPFRVRWPGALQAALGQGFVIIEEGRNGRTTVLDDLNQRGCNGKPALKQALHVHHPLVLVILLLGTNDLKNSFDRDAEAIAQGVQELGQIVLSNEQSSRGIAPMLLLVAPPMVRGEAHRSGLFRGVDVKSSFLAEQYRVVADRLGCEFFDAGAIIQSSREDGVHWDKEAHEMLGRELAQCVKDMFVSKGLYVKKSCATDEP